MRIDLNVPFAEKDAAKAAGARWDPARKVWYIENVEVLDPFMRWVKSSHAAPHKANKAHKPRGQVALEKAERRNARAIEVANMPIAEKIRLAGLAPMAPGESPQEWFDRQRGVNRPRSGQSAPQARQQDRQQDQPTARQISQSEQRKAPVATGIGTSRHAGAAGGHRYLPACDCFHIAPWDHCAHTDPASDAAEPAPQFYGHAAAANDDVLADLIAASGN